MAESKGERPEQPMAEHEDPTRKGVTSDRLGHRHGIPKGAKNDDPTGRPTSDRKETEVAARKQGGAGKGRA